MNIFIRYKQHREKKYLYYKNTKYYLILPTKRTKYWKTRNREK